MRGEAAFTQHAPTSVNALERKVADLERRCQQLSVENTILKSALPAGGTQSGTLGYLPPARSVRRYRCGGGVPCLRSTALTPNLTHRLSYIPSWNTNHNLAKKEMM